MTINSHIELKSIQNPPFESFVVKISSKCNYDCKYCYIYNLQDKGYLKQQDFMSDQTVYALAKRINEHAKICAPKDAHIILHGGEPLLIGADRFRHILSIFIENITEIKPTFTVQTNGSLIDDDWIRIFKEFDIIVGVSLDGTQEVNDLYRLDHGNRSTFKRTMKGLKRLIEDETISVGILSVMNPTTDPKRLIDFIVYEIGIKQFDFLFPHHHHDYSPYEFFGVTESDFSQYLVEIFDHWTKLNDPTIQIRFLDVIVGLVLGYDYAVDGFGARPIGYVSINTDGNYETLSSFKSFGNAQLPVSIFDTPIEDLYSHPEIALLRSGTNSLSSTCIQCKHKSVCGGGDIGHRYSVSRGFDNPSIYCKPLYVLLEHIELFLNRQESILIVDPKVKTRNA